MGLEIEAEMGLRERKRERERESLVFGADQIDTDNFGFSEVAVTTENFQAFFILSII